MKRVVITGVSTGIGHASAKVLFKQGFQVFGSVRNREDAARLQEEFGDLFVPLLFDVTVETAVRSEAARVSQLLGGDTLDGLVNNAGIEVAGPLAYLATDQFRYQLEVNLLGPFVLGKSISAFTRHGPGKKRQAGKDRQH